MEQTRQCETSRIIINKQDDAEQAKLWEQSILLVPEISNIMRNKQVHGAQAILFGTIQFMWIKHDYVKHTELCKRSKIIRNKEICVELALLFIKKGMVKQARLYVRT